jgi:hypothetical protein
LVGWNFVSGEDFRTAEEVSLEVEESVFLSGVKLLARLWPFPPAVASLMVTIDYFCCLAVKKGDRSPVL